MFSRYRLTKFCSYLQTYNSPRCVLYKAHFKEDKQQCLSFHGKASSNDFLLNCVDHSVKTCMYTHAGMNTTLIQHGENRVLSAQPESQRGTWHTLESKSFLTLLPTPIKYTFSCTHIQTLALII